MRSIFETLILATIATGIARGQSNVDSAHKFAWSEGVGWLNWRDAGSPAGTQGARAHDTFLSGFVWGENSGWINLGDGDPGPAGGSEVHYANVNGTDFGVNRDPASGDLFGLAWGENIGWIDFAGGALATPANPARFDESTCRLRGYAWAENVGWINLDHTGHYVGFDSSVCNGQPCPGDLDGDNVVGLADLAVLLSHFGTVGGADPEDGDLNGDQNVDLSDLAILLSNFGTTCP
jgi:hypothetical protein